MTQLFVGNLPYAATSNDLEQKINKVVKVKSIDLKMEDGKNIGYGYVEVDAHEEDIDDLINKLDNVELLDRPMRVKRKGDFTRKKRPSRSVFFTYIAQWATQRC